MVLIFIPEILFSQFFPILEQEHIEIVTFEACVD